jgi:serine/threonine-protein kinase HipA
MDRVGRVYFRDLYAGELCEVASGYSFIYDKKFIERGTPLSFNLPLQKDPFVSTALFSFFENLLSEGWMRSLQSRTLKIDENDKFGLLLLNGKDLIGAVTVVGKNNE